MKKFTAILVAIVLALFVVSCGGSSKDDDKTDTDTPDTENPDGDATDSGDEELDSCAIDSSFNQSNYESYYLLSGAGTIFSSDDQNAGGADLMKASLYDEAYPFVTFSGQTGGTSLLYGQVYEDGTEGLVVMSQYGELPQQAAGSYAIYYGVNVDTFLMQEDFDGLENGAIATSAPQLMMQDLLAATKANYTTGRLEILFYRTCTIGMNASEDGVNAAGRWQYCLGKDKTVGAGTNIKLGVDAALYTDLEGIEQAYEQQGYDRCSCYDFAKKANVECPEDFCDVIECEEGRECVATDKNRAGYMCKAACDAETENYNETKDTCECKEGYEKNKTTKKCEFVEKDACSDVKCETAGDVCVVDATADKGYKCEKKAECKAADNFVLNEKTNKCECKEGFMEEEGKCVKDPCYKNECKAEEVCLIDATVADKGYKCEKKAECKAEDNLVLNEKTNKCECKAGFEMKENKCEKKEEAPANPDKEACENAANGGTWENNTCNCGTGKTWNATDKACTAAAPATNPCEPNPCTGETPVCAPADNAAGYECTAAAPATNPCEPNPCTGETPVCAPADNADGYECTAE